LFIFYKAVSTFAVLEPKPALRSSVAMAFDDMEAMLKGLSDSLDPVAE